MSLEANKAIAAAAAKYAQSIKEGKGDYVKELLADNAVIYGMMGGDMIATPAADFVAMVDSGPAAPPTYESHVDVVCAEETIAVVRVLESGLGDMAFTGYLLMLKVGDDWKAVAKVFA